MPVRHIMNQDGSVTQVDSETGEELVTFFDPDGSYTRNYLEPAAAAAPAARPTGSNAERTFKRALELSPAKQTVRPDSETVTPERPKTDFETKLDAPARPSQQPATADPAAGTADETSGGIPETDLPLAAQQTSGLDERDRAVRQKRREELGATENAAAESRTEAERQQLDARAERVQAESDRALGRYATDLELHELAKERVNAAEEEAKEARRIAPNPAEGLAGDKFFFAVLANVGIAVSNFGASLLGQPGQADTNVVDDIVRASVTQQLADRGIQIEGAQDLLDSTRAELARAEMRANASLEKWFEAQAAVERDPEMRAAWSANADERRAAIERNQFQLAEAEYNTAVQQRAVPAPVKGGKAGVGPVNAETAEELDVLAANGIKQEDLTKYQKRREELGIAPTLRHISDVRQIIADLTEKGSTDVPGVGPIDERTQALLRSNDASKVDQALGFVVTAFIKQRSGAAVTDKEREYLSRIIKGTGSNQLESLNNGLRGVETEVTTALNDLNDGNSQAARAFSQIQELRKGRRQLSEEQQRNRDAQLNPEEGRRVISTDESGKEFFESPEARRSREAREARERGQQTREDSDSRARIRKALGF